ncbi:hypothetical protein DPEC_G00332110 [Dallia pectoralis]|uniref:Uncharacterized protein n=1 Tax=Dallia pectoralis TaxID=75939 RepID=A0ACC2F626_DALPE|nr:hypothetical protein DPEC_G00332110 [Dallia pectoralis]
MQSLMLTPEQRRSYRELVAALDRSFGKDKHRELALSALGRRERMPGQPLRALANDVERLTRRAYGHTPPLVQDELARDRFVLALSPPELTWNGETFQEMARVAGGVDKLGIFVVSVPPKLNGRETTVGLCRGGSTGSE